MIARRDLKELIEWERKPGSPVLSVYLDVDQSRAANLNRGFEAALKNELRFVQEQLLLKGKKKREEFRKDTERVLNFISRYEPTQRGLVIFCDASRKFFWHRQVNVPVISRAYWSERPHVRPLLEAFDEFERYGVILTGKAQARVFTVFLREIEEHQEAFAEADVRHIKGAGSDHGRSQMNIQRKADEHARWHLKRVAELVEELSNKYAFDRLVLAGPAGVTSELYGLLSKRLRQRVVASRALPVDSKPHHVLMETLKIEEKVERAGERKLVRELITAAAKNERAAIGLESTITAAEEGRIWRFVYAEDFAPGGAECVKCEVLFPGTKRSCPYCRGKLRRVNDLVERLVKQVVSAGGKAEQVREAAAKKLTDAGGVGAFLRF